MAFENVYEDDQRAAAYATLEFPGTYYLAYRDIPELIAKYANGSIALDFGCGTGRSTRFLNKLGFTAVGVDISAKMIAKASEFDPQGDYRVVADGDLGGLGGLKFDLVLSAFTFDNIPTHEKKVALLRQTKGLMAPEAIMLNLVSSPEIYRHEWASFTTKDFPENRDARSGDQVKIIMKDVEDSRPVIDILWSDEAYREVYQEAGLKLLQTHKPLGQSSEPYAWLSETEIAPWVIYILK
ncbi:MAG: class I SAM-dependent methyltransferase [bacterium]